MNTKLAFAGLAPGGISNEATEITQEGLRLPPIRIFKNNKPIDSAFEILKSNSRLPEFLIGDMWAGISAVQTGESRILELLNKYGMPLFQKALVVSMPQLPVLYFRTSKCSERQRRYPGYRR